MGAEHAARQLVLHAHRCRIRQTMQRQGFKRDPSDSDAGLTSGGRWVHHAAQIPRDGVAFGHFRCDLRATRANAWLR